METTVAFMKAAVLLNSSRLPQSLSLSSIGLGHMCSLKASCSRQCCSKCSAVMMSALRGHISDSPALNLYMWALSLLCPVLNLNRMTCFGLFCLWRLSDWKQQHPNYTQSVWDFHPRWTPKWGLEKARTPAIILSWSSWSVQIWTSLLLN